MTGRAGCRGALPAFTSRAAFFSRAKWPLVLTLVMASCVPSGQQATGVEANDEEVMVSLIEAAFRHVVSEVSKSSPQLPPGQDSLKISIESPPSRAQLSPLVMDALDKVTPKLQTPSAKGPHCYEVVDCTMDLGTVSMTLTGVDMLDNNRAEVSVATYQSYRPSKRRHNIFMTASTMLFERDGLAWTWIKDTGFLIT